MCDETPRRRQKKDDGRVVGLAKDGELRAFSFLPG